MIELRFTCKSCGITKHPVLVREREDGEALKDWMHALYYLVGDAHTALSPTCCSGKVDLMIPAPAPNGRVGQRQKK